ncbi:phosphate/phosphite/phosphonate ABC transporter substrate-binding protein [Roseibium sp.]|uniref:phosphate/phosphite/phosphonate ABC transporter substrate-binding protein n=1 Tax=Roseibium sp. TaxID=1936156 RepID=UPI003A97211A
MSVQFGWNEKALAEGEMHRLRFGIAVGSDETARERIEPFRVYLENALDMAVDLFLIDTLGELAEALSQGDIDYARLSPSAFGVVSASCRCVEPLATAAPDSFPPHYFSVLVTRKASQLNTLADLKGARLGTGEGTSIATHRVPLSGLLAEGIDPAQHFRTLVQVQTPIEGLQAVLDGRVDASLAWSTLSGSPETGYTAGTLNDFYISRRPGFSDLQIVWRSSPIPYTAHAVHTETPDAVKQSLREALLTLLETAPDVYLAVEPDYPGGLRPAVAADFRALERGYSPAFLSWLKSYRNR